MLGIMEMKGMRCVEMVTGTSHSRCSYIVEHWPWRGLVCASPSVRTIDGWLPQGTAGRRPEFRTSMIDTPALGIPSFGFLISDL